MSMELHPRGLASGQIPLGARIVAVVNTFDSVTSDAPCRTARSHVAGREEIRRCAGTQFDPTLSMHFSQ